MLAPFLNRVQIAACSSSNFANFRHNSQYNSTSGTLRVLKMLEIIFNESDEDKKGFLSREDLKVAVVRLFGYKPSKFEVDELMKNVDGPGMKINEFISAMKPKLAAVDPDEHIRQIFVAFDTKCRGFLTLEDVEKACKLVAPNIQPHRVLKAFSELDGDGDGRVSYRDFEFLMKYSVADAL